MRRLPRLLPIFCLFSLTTLTGCGLLYNFHEVHEDNFYRSGQLSARKLASVIEEFGIRTVINLRGEDPGDSWYDEEVAVCREWGVAHHSISMSSRRIPHREELHELLDLYRTSERPILVHCHGGSDRSGLASALWVIEYKGRTKRRARKQLSSKFYHFQDFSPSQRYFLRIYQGQEWAYEIYDPCEQDYRYYDKADCEGRRGSAASDSELPKP